VVEKAAILAWIIIDDHVFYDGCKRTGMSALILLVELNGYWLQATNDELVQTALRIAGEPAGDDYSYDDLVRWVRNRISLPVRRPWP